ncbi:MAG: HAMP domain-containing sensor histidine kinase [candidate division WOR-3 bacterium]
MASSRVRELQTEIVTGAEVFVRLSNDKIGEAFLRYFKNAFFKFRSIVISQKDLNHDLKNIQVVDLSGRILYDMELYEKGFFYPSDNKYTEDKFVLDNTKKMEINIHTDDQVCIVAPYIDEYGVHNYSVVYHFSRARLKKELSAVIINSVLMGVSTIILSIILSIIASNRITGHLKVLTNAAREIAQGDFNQFIKIKTGDEFEDLANAFNFMTEKIRDNIRELNGLVEELKKRDMQKTQFIANISHELRTPLTASIGYVDYIEKEKMGPLNQDQKHSLEIIHRNLERLNKEIHSLLLVSKYTLEGVKLKPEEFDISELIENVIKNFLPEIKLRGLTIQKSLTTTTFFGDKENIRTVVENLINNSIKFSNRETEIKIVTDVENREGQEYYRFKISNYGATIPPDQVGKIFEPFYQVDATTSRKYGGIGLGLSIAQNIIEAHQGKIWAESKDGLTTFYFIIPRGG